MYIYIYTRIYIYIYIHIYIYTHLSTALVFAHRSNHRYNSGTQNIAVTWRAIDEHIVANHDFNGDLKGINFVMLAIHKQVALLNSS